MSAYPFSHLHPADLASGVGPGTPAAAVGKLDTAMPQGQAAASTASDAVNTIVKIADARALQAGSEVQAVNIGFKFGDSMLGVRVEMRGGQVRTQFNTDSPELRSALAGEWGNLAANTAGHPYHFSDPVFAPASGGSWDFPSGSGGGAAGREDAPYSAAQRSSFNPDSRSLTPEAEAATPVPAGNSVPTARHLQTFA